MARPQWDTPLDIDLWVIGWLVALGAVAHGIVFMEYVRECK